MTQLFTKPTDAHLYLLPTSCHPRHTFLRIPYSQSLRIKRICSNNTDAQRHLHDLSNHLQKRGYNQDIITSAFERAENISREDLLKYKIKDKNERVPLVLTYYPKLAKTSSLIHKHLPTLHSSDRLKNVFPEPPLCSFRRTRNLKDLLVNVAIPIVHEDDPSTSHPPGFTKCPSKNVSSALSLMKALNFLAPSRVKHSL